MNNSLNKSLVTFIRKELGLKGPSEHTGRGQWRLWAVEETSYSDIVEKIQALLPKWRKKHLVVKAEVTDKKLSIRFSGKVFDPYYSTFAVDEDTMKYCLTWRHPANLVGHVNFTSTSRRH